MGNAQQISPGGYGPVTSAPVTISNTGIGLSTQLIIWGMVACVLAELIGILCLLRFCCSRANRRKTKYIEKEIIIREDIKKYDENMQKTTSKSNASTMNPKGLTSFQTKIPLIISNQTPRPYRQLPYTPSDSIIQESHQQQQQHSSSQRISHTEFHSLYDVDETKFSTLKSYVTTKDNLIKQQKSLDALVNATQQQKFAPQVLTGAPPPATNSNNQSINSKDDGVVYSYDGGFLNAAFADISHADFRSASPVRLEETRNLPRVVTHFEPPGDDRLFKDSPRLPLRANRSYSPDNVPKDVSAPRHRATSEIEYKQPLSRPNIDKPVLLSYGQQTNSGVPIKWHLGKEFETVDWEQLKKDSIIERSYPHANMIEPVLDDSHHSNRSDVRKLFADQPVVSPVHKALDTVLPPISAYDSFHAELQPDSGANKVGLEVPFQNPFLKNALFSSPRTSTYTQPAPQKSSDPLETVKYEVNRNSSDLRRSTSNIQNEIQKKTAIEKLISDLSTEENDSPANKKDTPMPSHPASRSSSISHLSTVQVVGAGSSGPPPQPHQQNNNKFINKIDVVSTNNSQSVDDDKATKRLSSVSSNLSFPKPPPADFYHDSASILNESNESHNNSKQNPLFKEENNEQDKQLQQRVQLRTFTPRLNSLGSPTVPPPPLPPATQVTNTTTTLPITSILSEIRDFKSDRLKSISNTSNDNNNNNNNSNSMNASLSSNEPPTSPPHNFKNSEEDGVIKDELNNDGALW